MQHRGVHRKAYLWYIQRDQVIFIFLKKCNINLLYDLTPNMFFVCLREIDMWPKREVWLSTIILNYCLNLVLSGNADTKGFRLFL